ncbi:MAG TPA: hypothetical protein PK513_08510 [Alphaproteobacteria bacterium]|nr:hypothetical protein [Alphaproteobacteria bacterium]USO04688.1 MAG: hypothetical protein H6859_05830 [Rhodospirillales bacterium]HOO82530.1 hypothetical protein [Alphaproteobacteria bacterium]
MAKKSKRKVKLWRLMALIVLVNLAFFVFYDVQTNTVWGLDKILQAMGYNHHG